MTTSGNSLTTALELRLCSEQETVAFMQLSVHLAAVAGAGGQAFLAAIILPVAWKDVAAVIGDCRCLGRICVAACSWYLAAASCCEVNRDSADLCSA